MIQFYAPEIETCHVLPESDSGHCVRVLRMKAGDMIEVIDGRGNRFKCRLVEPHSKRAVVEIVERERVELPWKNEITVAVAPTKNMDRMEWLVEKLTEIGVNRFIPMLCSHSERREIKRERLEKIAVSAMKQSLKAVLPEIMPMTPIAEILCDVRMASAQRFIAYCDRNVERKVLAREYAAGRDVLILIGPEGDFTAEEVERSIGAGCVPVTLGDNRLRTETAAMVSADTIHIINQMRDSEI
ncbi:MAG: 16S rRNA (uracil(1498)-N(3))-methyltransferase [Muribaculaceae bacterium]|nr:16S rRNA (uracil(1498)-N(3))-methyltransferase [Muribaculaceae bacterium]